MTPKMSLFWHAWVRNGVSGKGNLTCLTNYGPAASSSEATSGISCAVETVHACAPAPDEWESVCLCLNYPVQVEPSSRLCAWTPAS